MESEESYYTLPISDYFFRYDRAAFWMGRYMRNPLPLLRLLLSSKKQRDRRIAEVFNSYTPPPKLTPSIIERITLSFFVATDHLYYLLHSLPENISNELFVIQDCMIPFAQVENFLETLYDHLDLFPLWLCPVKATETPQLFSPHKQESPLLMNIGIYGMPRTRDGRAATENLERLTASVGGRKMLYAENRYSEDVFWTIYPKEAWDELRDALNASSLPPIYKRLVSIHH